MTTGELPGKISKVMYRGYTITHDPHTDKYVLSLNGDRICNCASVADGKHIVNDRQRRSDLGEMDE